MKFSANEIRAAIAFARTSGIVDVPARILTLDKRVDDHATAIAVIGMINRGKSTLFNRLVGAEISAISATPETAATIRVQTGRPSAWGRTVSGSIVEIQSDPEKFMERLRRGDQDRIVSASISGSFRLPEGLMLIDTPGVGDVAVQIEDALSDLDEQWIEAGAGAALVVFAVPTIDADDRALLMRARDAFPGAVEVVVKRTSRDFTLEDVNEVAIDFSNKYGINVLVLDDIIPEGGWGQDEAYAEVENLLLDLDHRAEVRLQGDIERFSQFIELIDSELKSAKLVDLPSVKSAAAVPSLPEVLNASVKTAIDRLEGLQRSIDEAAEREQKRLATIASDRKAQSLIAIYSTVSESDWNERFELLRQISECAVEGSKTSIVFLQESLKKEVDWPQTVRERRLYFSIALGGIPPNLLESAIFDAALTLEERQYFLVNNLPAAQHAALERSLVTMAGGQTSDVLAQFLRVVKDPENAKKVEKLRLDALRKEQSNKVQAAIQHLRSTAGNSALAVATDAIDKASSDIESALKRAVDVPNADLGRLRNTAELEIAAAWNSLGVRVLRAFKSWFETWPDDAQAAGASLRVLLDAADRIAPRVPDLSISRLINEYSKFAADRGGSWVLEVQRHTTAAKWKAYLQVDSSAIGFYCVCIAMVAASALAYFSPVFILGCFAALVLMFLIPKPGPLAPWQRLFVPIALLTTLPDPYRPKELKPPDQGAQTSGGGRGFALGAIAVVLSFIIGSISLTLFQLRQQNELYGLKTTWTLPSDFDFGRSSTSSSLVSTTTTSTVRSSSTTVPASTGSRSSIDTTRPTELTSAFAQFDPKSCGINVDVKESYPHDATNTYEVTASAGLWSTPSTNGSLLKTIQVTSYGPAGFGCPDGLAPSVTVICKVTAGQALRNGIWTNSHWVKTTFQGATGYISQWFVDTRWDIYSIPIC